MTNDLIPRGIRNNNPLNIRHSKDHWQGMASEQPDPAFITFITPVMGLRAAMKIISNYGLKDVWAIISKWAPNTENNTAAYADSVAAHMQISVHDEINLKDEATMVHLIQGMILVENGKPSRYPNWVHKNENFWYPENIYEAAWGSLHSSGK